MPARTLALPFSSRSRPAAPYRLHSLMSILRDRHNHTSLYWRLLQCSLWMSARWVPLEQCWPTRLPTPALGSPRVWPLLRLTSCSRHAATAVRGSGSFVHVGFRRRVRSACADLSFSA